MRQQGRQVCLAVLRGDLVEEGLVASIAPDVPMDVFQPWGLRHVMRLDGLIQRIGIDFSWLRWWQQRWLARLLLRRGARLVHSHLITSDLVAARACATAKIPWLSTMHGDYLAFEPAGGNRAARIPDFARAIEVIERRVGAVVCITDDQQRQMRRLMPTLGARGGIRKIYNGYPRPARRGRGDATAAPALTGIPEEALVVGMVARGIRDKGWDVLLEAVRKAPLLGVWLVLVGDGPRIAELRAATRDERVRFVGNVTNPLDYIARFDIACLPSRFPAESLPTVVIEYLQQGKPVIATHVAEIPAMLQLESGAPAGITIALDSESSMADAMCAALTTLAQDRELRSRLSRAALAAFEPFAMELCVARYSELYAEVAHAN